MTAAMVGEDAARSTTTIFACRAISRASVSAVSVMLSLEAVPRTVTLRAADAGADERVGQLLDFVDLHRDILARDIHMGMGLTNTGAGANTGSRSAVASAAIAGSSGTIAGARSCSGGESTTTSRRDGGATAASGAVMRSNSPVTIAPR